MENQVIKYNEKPFVAEQPTPKRKAEEQLARDFTKNIFGNYTCFDNRELRNDFDDYWRCKKCGLIICTCNTTK